MKRNLYMMSGGRLKRKDNTLYFENEAGIKKAIPIEQVDALHFFGQVDLNTATIHLLSQHDVPIHFYNYYGFYDGSFMPRKQKVSGYSLVKQCEHVSDLSKRLFLAKCFVSSGIHHMQRNIRKHTSELTSLMATISSHSASLQDAGNIATVMGIEGHCRQLYYESFRTLLKGDDSIQWEYRSKRPPHDPINALISYGNSMMYTTVLSEVYKTVLDPTVSYLHEPSAKRFSLCLDIAEIFKPFIVDAIILSLVNNRRIQSQHFTVEDGICYLNEEGRKRFVEAYDEKLKTTFKHRLLKRNVTYRYAIRLEAYKLIKHVTGDKTYKPFKAWW